MTLLSPKSQTKTLSKSCHLSLHPAPQFFSPSPVASPRPQLPHPSLGYCSSFLAMSPIPPQSFLNTAARGIGHPRVPTSFNQVYAMAGNRAQGLPSLTLPSSSAPASLVSPAPQHTGLVSLVWGTCSLMPTQLNLLCAAHLEYCSYYCSLPPTQNPLTPSSCFAVLFPQELLPSRKPCN